MTPVHLTPADLAESHPFAAAIRRAVRADLGELAAEGLAVGKAGVTLRDGRNAKLPPVAAAAYREWLAKRPIEPLSFDLELGGQP